jgi:hypothetical protein
VLSDSLVAVDHTSSTRISNVLLLSYMGSYDVVSNICQALIEGASAVMRVAGGRAGGVQRGGVERRGARRVVRRAHRLRGRALQLDPGLTPG